MIRRVEALIPIRSFDGMTRLGSLLDLDDRMRLSLDLANRTVRAAVEAGTRVSVVTADADVARWALASDIESIAEPTPGGLNVAAAAAVAAIGDGPWLVVHADLPALDADDVRAAANLVEGGHVVLAPSHDGGTSLIGGSASTFPFRYGPWSFRRHLAAIDGDATILIRPGLALDLDRPWDLQALKRLGHLDSR